MNAPLRLGDLSLTGAVVDRVIATVRDFITETQITEADLVAFIGYLDRLETELPITDPTNYRKIAGEIARARQRVEALRPIFRQVRLEEAFG